MEIALFHADGAAGSWWQSLVIGAVGSAIALVGVIVTLLVSNRAQRLREDRQWRRDREERNLAYERSRRDWMRDLRVKHYLEISEHISLWSRIANGEKFNDRNAIRDAYRVTRELNYRVRLLAPDNIRIAWKPLKETVERWRESPNLDVEGERSSFNKLSRALMAELRGEFEPFDEEG